MKMDRRFQWTTLSLAIAAALCFGQSAIAQCDSGGCASVGYANGGYAVAPGGYGGGCASGGCSSGFGYPGDNCGGCGAAGVGHHNGPIKQHVHHLAEIQKRDFARNQAWPKPFDCADRQLYFSMWDSMLEKGYRSNCVFTAQHFDKDTNELNESGRSKIAGIFKNNPTGQKVALVQNIGNSSVVDSRLRNLQSTVDKWYGNNAFSEIAMAREFPTNFSGLRAETINFKVGEAIADPIIPVATGTGSTSDVGVGE